MCMFFCHYILRRKVCLFSLVKLYKEKPTISWVYYNFDKMITNINYVGQVSGSIDHLPFRTVPPLMYINKSRNFTLVLFKCGKCRLMGCKRPLQTKIVQVDDLLSVTISRIQSVSVSFDVGGQLSLSQLGNFCHRESIRYMFEPELFPALRLSHLMHQCLCKR